MKKLNYAEAQALLRRIAVHRVNGEREEAARLLDHLRKRAGPRVKLDLVFRMVEAGRKT